MLEKPVIDESVKILQGVILGGTSNHAITLYHKGICDDGHWGKPSTRDGQS